MSRLVSVITLFAFVIPLATCAAVLPAQILSNPAFDEAEPFTGWVQRGQEFARPELVTDPVVSGPHALKLTIQGSGSMGDDSFMIYQILNHEQYRGQRVRFGAHVKTEGAGVNLVLWTPEGSASEFDENVHNGDYVAYSGHLDVPSDASFLSFGVQVLGPGGGVAYVDNAFVEVEGGGPSEDEDPDEGPAEGGSDQVVGGYIDSPFVMPDGSAIYFLHSPASTYDFGTGNRSLRPATQPIPGHHDANGSLWWNTDLYVSERNGDGTWGFPKNLGDRINTEHLECCAWVSDDGKILIFTREGLGDSSPSGSFIATRNDRDDSWGDPERIPGDMGRYTNSDGLHDFHLTRRGDLYSWTEQGGGVLHMAPLTGDREWANAKPLPDSLQSRKTDTQPWVNGSETILYYNRRGDDGNTELIRSTRQDPDAPWGPAESLRLVGFADPGGAMVWGEPSWTSDGTLFFVRFDTSRSGWPAQLLKAEPREDGGFGPPTMLQFRH